MTEDSWHDISVLDAGHASRRSQRARISTVWLAPTRGYVRQPAAASP